MKLHVSSALTTEQHADLTSLVPLYPAALLPKMAATIDVHFDGRFNRLSGVTLEPPPTQQPHPPIWIAGRSKAAMKRAARYGDGWLPYFYTPEVLPAFRD